MTRRLSPESIPARPPDTEPALPPGRCDAACPAKARVHVIRTPAQALSFCQHHFREHMFALIADGWQQAG